VAPDLLEYLHTDVADGTWNYKPWYLLHSRVRALIDNDKTRLFAAVREALT
jgi:hypothetical protein